MNVPRIAIVSALPEEMRPLRSRLVGARRLPTLAEGVAGTIAGQAVMLVVVGDGQRNARAGIAALLGHWPIERLIVIGAAGALTRDLRPAALVVAAQVRDRVDSFAADPALVKTALQRTGGQPATAVSAERLVSSPAERARLLRDLGGEARTAVADLESAVLVRAAREHKVPWLVLRAVSDSADESLPAVLDRSHEAGGGINRGRVLRGLLLEPGAVPSLLALRWRVGRCAQLLATATERLLYAQPGTGVAA